ncbi:AraC family transcriptional regulator [Hymenobacter volaticus]|uniref:Helix-turn-helix domain-containing protein n=1 Tax=Hymenobacter volaticus TaxID=2932254 RepID=A0ABY4GDY1_9BACT|nr:helix-turn-helix domain-containing protein [Hymenobacter volaticus]UOQ69132.1 helix-turn-helix domain-containing protein [Hymenobacter volaticus]
MGIARRLCPLAALCSLAAALARPCGIAGVFFRPGVVHHLLRYPMHELTSQPLDLEAFFGPPVRLLQAQLQDALSPAARVERLDAFLSDRLPVLAQSPTYSDYILHQLAQHPGAGAVQAWARELRVSRQFLARHFAEQVGRSPKQMSRVVRFNALHQALVQAPPPSWLDLVYQFNYYDQAHLIKDFTAFTGLSPTTYQHAPSAAADFYAGRR